MRCMSKPSRELVVRALDRDLLSPPVIDEPANRLDVVVDAGDVARSDEHGSVEEAGRIAQGGHKDPSRRRGSAAE